MSSQSKSRQVRRKVAVALHPSKGVFNWSGHFFTPIVGESYLVPSNAAEYKRLRGKSGECISVNQIENRAWAKIKFEDIEDPQTVRTCYLVDKDGNQVVLQDQTKANLTPAEMFANVWANGGNSGTVEITGKM